MHPDHLAQNKPSNLPPVRSTTSQNPDSKWLKHLFHCASSLKKGLPTESVTDDPDYDKLVRLLIEDSNGLSVNLKWFDFFPDSPVELEGNLDPVQEKRVDALYHELCALLEKQPQPAVAVQSRSQYHKVKEAVIHNSQGAIKI